MSSPQQLLQDHIYLHQDWNINQVYVSIKGGAIRFKSFVDVGPTFASHDIPYEILIFSHSHVRPLLGTAAPGHQERLR